ncbi:MAG: hypothetical protein E6J34_12295 [Chloroflexi bacterium]|nr:MAG: hypothetical protein E6J34_12295 [Chloroflexota bacterium]
MPYTLSQQPVSHDFVPRGSLCEWCGDEAVEQLTALGGPHHNQSGRFCSSCARAFMQKVRAHTASSLVLRTTAREQLASAPVQSQEQRAEPVDETANQAIPLAIKQSLWLCQLT